MSKYNAENHNSIFYEASAPMKETDMDSFSDLDDIGHLSGDEDKYDDSEFENKLLETVEEMDRELGDFLS